MPHAFIWREQGLYIGGVDVLNDVDRPGLCLSSKQRQQQLRQEIVPLLRVCTVQDQQAAAEAVECIIT